MILFPQRGSFTKAVAFLLSVCFCFTSTISYAQSIDVASAISSPKEFRTGDRLSQIEIPIELGQITKTIPSQASGGLLIHIQDAHGQLDAQKSIENILEHLNGRYGLSTVFLEGGLQGKISPDLLRFSEDEKTNERIADYLLKENIIGGPGKFILRSGNAVRIHGVEQAPLYKENLESFRNVYLQKEKSDRFLNEFKTKITTLGSRRFNPSLRTFLKEWLLYQDSKQDIFAHLNHLDEGARAHLNLDLRDTRNQLEYPQLVRLFKLKEVEAKAESQKSGVEKQKERRQLIRWLEAHKINPALRERVRMFLYRFDGSSEFKQKLGMDLRSFLEQFYETAHAQGFSFKDYPVLSRSLGAAILKQEMNPTLLFEEIESLAQKILGTLIQTDEEKKLIELFKSYLLLKKLFSLEATRAEFQAMSQRKKLLQPASIAQTLASLGSGSLRNMDGMDASFGEAMHFYELAFARENIIAEHVFSTMKTTGTDRAVLVTGGFHSEKFQEFAREQGLSYLEISPRMALVESNEKYLKQMMLGTPSSSTVPNFLLDRLSISQIEKHFGPKPAQFLRSQLEEAIETATPKPPVVVSDAAAIEQGAPVSRSEMRLPEESIDKEFLAVANRKLGELRNRIRRQIGEVRDAKREADRERSFKNRYLSIAGPAVVAYSAAFFIAFGFAVGGAATVGFLLYFATFLLRTGWTLDARIEEHKQLSRDLTNLWEFRNVIHRQIKQHISEHSRSGHDSLRSEARLPDNSAIGGINPKDVRESSIASQSRAEARDFSETVEFYRRDLLKRFPEMASWYMDPEKALLEESWLQHGRAKLRWFKFEVDRTGPISRSEFFMRVRRIISEMSRSAPKEKRTIAATIQAVILAFMSEIFHPDPSFESASFRGALYFMRRYLLRLSWPWEKEFDEKTTISSTDFDRFLTDLEEVVPGWSEQSRRSEARNQLTQDFRKLLNLQTGAAYGIYTLMMSATAKVLLETPLLYSVFAGIGISLGTVLIGFFGARYLRDTYRTRSITEDEIKDIKEKPEESEILALEKKSEEGIKWNKEDYLSNLSREIKVKVVKGGTSVIEKRKIVSTLIVQNRLERRPIASAIYEMGINYIKVLRFTAPSFDSPEAKELISKIKALSTPGDRPIVSIYIDARAEKKFKQFAEENGFQAALLKNFYDGKRDAYRLVYADIPPGQDQSLLLNLLRKDALDAMEKSAKVDRAVLELSHALKRKIKRTNQTEKFPNPNVVFNEGAREYLEKIDQFAQSVMNFLNRVGQKVEMQAPDFYEGEVGWIRDFLTLFSNQGVSIELLKQIANFMLLEPEERKAGKWVFLRSQAVKLFLDPKYFNFIWPIFGSNKKGLFAAFRWGQGDYLELIQSAPMTEDEVRTTLPKLVDMFVNTVQYPLELEEQKYYQYSRYRNFVWWVLNHWFEKKLISPGQIKTYLASLKPEQIGQALRVLHPFFQSIQDEKERIQLEDELFGAVPHWPDSWNSRFFVSTGDNKGFKRAGENDVLLFPARIQTVPYEATHLMHGVLEDAKVLAIFPRYDEVTERKLVPLSHVFDSIAYVRFYIREVAGKRSLIIGDLQSDAYDSDHLKRKKSTLNIYQDWRWVAHLALENYARLHGIEQIISPTPEDVIKRWPEIDHGFARFIYQTDLDRHGYHFEKSLPEIPWETGVTLTSGWVHSVPEEDPVLDAIFTPTSEREVKIEDVSRGMRAGEAMKLLKEGTPGEKINAMQRLQHLDHRQAIPLIAETAKNSSLPKEVRMAAMIGLRYMAARDFPELLTSVFDKALKDGEPLIVKVAFNTLLSLNMASFLAKALPFLRSRNPEVKQAVFEYVRHFGVFEEKKSLIAPSHFREVSMLLRRLETGGFVFDIGTRHFKIAGDRADQILDRIQNFEISEYVIDEWVPIARGEEGKRLAHFVGDTFRQYSKILKSYSPEDPFASFKVVNLARMEYETNGVRLFVQGTERLIEYETGMVSALEKVNDAEVKKVAALPHELNAEILAEFKLAAYAPLIVDSPDWREVLVDYEKPYQEAIQSLSRHVSPRSEARGEDRGEETWKELSRLGEGIMPIWTRYQNKEPLEASEAKKFKPELARLKQLVRQIEKMPVPNRNQAVFQSSFQTRKKELSKLRWWVFRSRPVYWAKRVDRWHKRLTDVPEAVSISVILSTAAGMILSGGTAAYFEGQMGNATVIAMLGGALAGFIGGWTFGIWKFGTNKKSSPDKKKDSDRGPPQSSGRSEARSDEPSYAPYELKIPYIFDPQLLTGDEMARSEPWKEISKKMIQYAARHYREDTAEDIAFVVVVRSENRAMIISHNGQVMNKPSILRELFYDVPLIFEEQLNRQIIRGDLIDGGYQVLDFGREGMRYSHVLIVDAETRPSLRSEVRGFSGMFQRWWQTRREKRLDYWLDNVEQILKEINFHASTPKEMKQRLDELELLQTNIVYLDQVEAIFEENLPDLKLTPLQKERKQALKQKYEHYNDLISERYDQLTDKKDRDDLRSEVRPEPEEGKADEGVEAGLKVVKNFYGQLSAKLTRSFFRFFNWLFAKYPKLRLPFYLLDRAGLNLWQQVGMIFMTALFAMSGPWFEVLKAPATVAIPATLIYLGLGHWFIIGAALVVNWLWLGAIVRLPFILLFKLVFWIPVGKVMIWNSVPFVGAYAGPLAQLLDAYRRIHQGYEDIGILNLTRLNKKVLQSLSPDYSSFSDEDRKELIALSPRILFLILDFQREHQREWEGKFAKVRGANLDAERLNTKIEHKNPTIFLDTESHVEGVRRYLASRNLRHIPFYSFDAEKFLTYVREDPKRVIDPAEVIDLLNVAKGISAEDLLDLVDEEAEAEIIGPLNQGVPLARLKIYGNDRTWRKSLGRARSKLDALSDGAFVLLAVRRVISRRRVDRRLVLATKKEIVDSMDFLWSGIILPRHYYQEPPHQNTARFFYLLDLRVEGKLKLDNGRRGIVYVSNIAAALALQSGNSQFSDSIRRNFAELLKARYPGRAIASVTLTRDSMWDRGFKNWLFDSFSKARLITNPKDPIAEAIGRLEEKDSEGGIDYREPWKHPDQMELIAAVIPEENTSERNRSEARQNVFSALAQPVLRLAPLWGMMIGSAIPASNWQILNGFLGAGIGAGFLAFNNYFSNPGWKKIKTDISMNFPLVFWGFLSVIGVPTLWWGVTVIAIGGLVLGFILDEFGRGKQQPLLDLNGRDPYRHARLFLIALPTLDWLIKYISQLLAEAPVHLHYGHEMPFVQDFPPLVPSSLIITQIIWTAFVILASRIRIHFGLVWLTGGMPGDLGELSLRDAVSNPTPFIDSHANLSDYAMMIGLGITMSELARSIRTRSLNQFFQRLPDRELPSFRYLRALIWSLISAIILGLPYTAHWLDQNFANPSSRPPSAVKNQPGEKKEAELSFHQVPAVRSEARGREARLGRWWYTNLAEALIREREKEYELVSSWKPAVVVFGGARVPEGHPYYKTGIQLGEALARRGLSIRTGTADIGLMHAPFEGHKKVKRRGKQRQGARISLSFEQNVSPLVESMKPFDYFFIRKLALHENILGAIVLPGGYGTLDELFEVWRRGRPFVLLGKEYWDPLFNETTGAFYKSWRAAGLMDQLNIRIRPFITDSIPEAIDYVLNMSTISPPYKPTREQHKKINDEMGSGLQKLSRMAHRPVVMVGRPNPNHEQGKYALGVAERLANRLAARNVPIRVGSQGLFDRLFQAAKRHDWIGFLYSVLYVPDQNTLPNGVARLKKMGHTLTLEDESNHQYLIAVDAGAFVFFPGGVGTMNKLYDLATNMQTGKIERRPIFVVGRHFYQRIKSQIAKTMIRRADSLQLLNENELDIIQIVDNENQILEQLGLTGPPHSRSEVRLSTDVDKPSKHFESRNPLVSTQVDSSKLDVSNYAGRSEVRMDEDQWIGQLWEAIGNEVTRPLRVMTIKGLNERVLDEIEENATINGVTGKKREKNSLFKPPMKKPAKHFLAELYKAKPPESDIDVQAISELTLNLIQVIQADSWVSGDLLIDFLREVALIIDKWPPVGLHKSPIWNDVDFAAGRIIQFFEAKPHTEHLPRTQDELRRLIYFKSDQRMATYREDITKKVKQKINRPGFDPELKARIEKGLTTYPTKRSEARIRVEEAMKAAEVLQTQNGDLEKAQETLRPYPKFRIHGTLIANQKLGIGIVFYGNEFIGKSTLATLVSGYDIVDTKLTKIKDTGWDVMAQPFLEGYLVEGEFIVGLKPSVSDHLSHIERRGLSLRTYSAEEQVQMGFIRVPLFVHFMRPEDDSEDKPAVTFEIGKGIHTDRNLDPQDPDLFTVTRGNEILSKYPKITVAISALHLTDDEGEREAAEKLRGLLETQLSRSEVRVTSDQVYQVYAQVAAALLETEPRKAQILGLIKSAARVVEKDLDHAFDGLDGAFRIFDTGSFKGNVEAIKAAGEALEKIMDEVDSARLEAPPGPFDSALRLISELEATVDINKDAFQPETLELVHQWAQNATNYANREFPGADRLNDQQIKQQIFWSVGELRKISDFEKVILDPDVTKKHPRRLRGLVESLESQTNIKATTAMAPTIDIIRKLREEGGNRAEARDMEGKTPFVSKAFKDELARLIRGGYIAEIRDLFEKKLEGDEQNRARAVYVLRRLDYEREIRFQEDGLDAAGRFDVQYAYVFRGLVALLTPQFFRNDILLAAMLPYHFPEHPSEEEILQSVVRRFMDIDRTITDLNLIVAIKRGAKKLTDEQTRIATKGIRSALTKVTESFDLIHSLELSPDRLFGVDELYREGHNRSSRLGRVMRELGIHFRRPEPPQASSRSEARKPEFENGSRSWKELLQDLYFGVLSIVSIVFFTVTLFSGLVIAHILTSPPGMFGPPILRPWLISGSLGLGMFLGTLYLLFVLPEQLARREQGYRSYRKENRAIALGIANDPKLKDNDLSALRAFADGRISNENALDRFAIIYFNRHYRDKNKAGIKSGDQRAARILKQAVKIRKSLARSEARLPNKSVTSNDYQGARESSMLSSRAEAREVPKEVWELFKGSEKSKLLLAELLLVASSFKYVSRYNFETGMNEIVPEAELAQLIYNEFAPQLVDPGINFSKDNPQAVKFIQDINAKLFNKPMFLEAALDADKLFLIRFVLTVADPEISFFALLHLAKKLKLYGLSQEEQRKRLEEDPELDQFTADLDDFLNMFRTGNLSPERDEFLRKMVDKIKRTDRFYKGIAEKSPPAASTYEEIWPIIERKLSVRSEARPEPDDLDGIVKKATQKLTTDDIFKILADENKDAVHIAEEEPEHWAAKLPGVQQFRIELPKQNAVFQITIGPHQFPRKGNWLVVTKLFKEAKTEKGFSTNGEEAETVLKILARLKELTARSESRGADDERDISIEPFKNQVSDDVWSKLEEFKKKWEGGETDAAKTILEEAIWDHRASPKGYDQTYTDLRQFADGLARSEAREYQDYIGLSSPDYRELRVIAVNLFRLAKVRKMPNPFTWESRKIQIHFDPSIVKEWLAEQNGVAITQFEMALAGALSEPQHGSLHRTEKSPKPWFVHRIGDLNGIKIYEVVPGARSEARGEPQEPENNARLPEMHPVVLDYDSDVLKVLTGLKDHLPQQPAVLRVIAANPEQAGALEKEGFERQSWPTDIKETVRQLFLSGQVKAVRILSDSKTSMAEITLEETVELVPGVLIDKIYLETTNGIKFSNLPSAKVREFFSSSSQALFEDLNRVNGLITYLDNRTIRLATAFYGLPDDEEKKAIIAESFGWSADFLLSESEYRQAREKARMQEEREKSQAQRLQKSAAGADESSKPKRKKIRLSKAALQARRFSQERDHLNRELASIYGQYLFVFDRSYRRSKLPWEKSKFSDLIETVHDAREKGQTSFAIEILKELVRTRNKLVEHIRPDRGVSISRRQLNELAASLNYDSDIRYLGAEAVGRGIVQQSELPEPFNRQELLVKERQLHRTIPDAAAVMLASDRLQASLAAAVEYYSSLSPEIRDTLQEERRTIQSLMEVLSSDELDAALKAYLYLDFDRLSVFLYHLEDHKQFPLPLSLKDAIISDAVALFKSIYADAITDARLEKYLYLDASESRAEARETVRPEFAQKLFRPFSERLLGGRAALESFEVIDVISDPKIDEATLRLYGQRSAEEIRNIKLLLLKFQDKLHGPRSSYGLFVLDDKEVDKEGDPIVLLHAHLLINPSKDFYHVVGVEVLYRFADKQALFQRATALLLLKTSLHKSVSGINPSDPAVRMYRRIAKDPRFEVQEIFDPKIDERYFIVNAKAEALAPAARSEARENLIEIAVHAELSPEELAAFLQAGKKGFSSMTADEGKVTRKVLDKRGLLQDSKPTDQAKAFLRQIRDFLQAKTESELHALKAKFQSEYEKTSVVFQPEATESREDLSIDQTSTGQKALPTVVDHRGETVALIAKEEAIADRPDAKRIQYKLVTRANTARDIAIAHGLLNKGFIIDSFEVGGVKKGRLFITEQIQSGETITINYVPKARSEAREKLESSDEQKQRRDKELEILNAQKRPISSTDLALALAQIPEYKFLFLSTVKKDAKEDPRLNQHPNYWKGWGVVPKYFSKESVEEELNARKTKGWANHAMELQKGTHPDQSLYKSAVKFGIKLPKLQEDKDRSEARLNAVIPIKQSVPVVLPTAIPSFAQIPISIPARVDVAQDVAFTTMGLNLSPEIRAQVYKTLFPPVEQKIESARTDTAKRIYESREPITAVVPISGDLDETEMDRLVAGAIAPLRQAERAHEVLVLIQGDAKNFARLFNQSFNRVIAKAKLKLEEVKSVRAGIHLENAQNFNQYLLSGRKVIVVGALQNGVVIPGGHERLITDQLLDRTAFSQDEIEQSLGAFVTGAFDVLLRPIQDQEQFGQDQRGNWLAKSKSALEGLANVIQSILERRIEREITAIAA